MHFINVLYSLLISRWTTLYIKPPLDSINLYYTKRRMQRVWTVTPSDIEWTRTARPCGGARATDVRASLQSLSNTHTSSLCSLLIENIISILNLVKYISTNISAKIHYIYLHFKISFFLLFSRILFISS